MCLRFVLCDVLAFVTLIYCILTTLESWILEYNTSVSQIYVSSLLVVDIVTTFTRDCEKKCFTTRTI